MQPSPRPEIDHFIQTLLHQSSLQSFSRWVGKTHQEGVRASYILFIIALLTQSDGPEEKRPMKKQP